jgi:hypothetical protein
MATIPYPLINGTKHDFTSIRAEINGIKIFGISAIDYTIAKPVSDVYGTSSMRLGRTRGQLKFTGSLTLYETEFAALTQSLAVVNEALMEKEFLIIVQYSDGGLPLITDQLIGCMITNIGHSHSQGNNALVVKLELDIDEITLNGVRMLDSKGLPSALNAAL